MKKIDKRLGKEVGLGGRYATMPVFQIVENAHDSALSLGARMVDFSYSGDGHQNTIRWSQIKARQTELMIRAGRLGDDAVAAAALSDEILRFTQRTLDPFIAECIKKDACE